MARWVCYGERELGQIDAADRAGAERLGRRLFGGALVRVQSVVSRDAAQGELRMEPREPWEDDP